MMNKPIMESEDELRRVQNIIEQDRINAVANKLTAALDSTSPLKDSVQRLRNELEAE